MTSKLKCPFCGETLRKYGEVDPDTRTSIVLGANCPKCNIGNSDIKLWQALIQAKQDLEIARKALKDARIFADTHCIATAVKTIDKALTQIENKE